MDEKAIVQQQQQNIPEPTQHTPAPITAPELTGFGSANIELDEITQYKLHDVLDQKYDPNDETTRQQLQYIYERVSDMVDEKDYVTISAKMRELMRIAGITHSDRKLYKLYQWVKLSNIMKKTNIEMENLRDV